MKRLWWFCGNVAFWLSWPGLWVYLRFGRRTRALIVAEGEVLVVRPWMSTGHWGLPGGGLHYGEDPVEGILREVREEAGLRLEPEQLRFLGERTIRQRGLTYRCVCFVAELPRKPPIRRQFLEVAEVAWLPLANLTHQNSTADVTEVMAAWRQ